MTLHTEIALSMAVLPSEGLVFTLYDRTGGRSTQVHRWAMQGRTATVPEVEDVVSQVTALIYDHLLIGPGVQLALHD